MIHDLTNRTFGRLNVIRRAASPKGRPRAYWHCVCNCGKEAVVSGNNLLSGITRSCGCMHHERLGNDTRTHGKSRTPEYHAWHNMMRRCYNREDKSYPEYGGRGLDVCERWHSFENFLADMGSRPDSNMSLDRRNNDCGYCPDNCRWATASQQQMNRRVRNKVGFKGVSFVQGKYQASFGTRESHWYLGRFDTAEEAARAYNHCAISERGDEARINPL